MLVNSRPLYILVDGLHYSSGGQVISTVTCFYVSATAIVWIPRDTLSNRDQTRPNETSITLH
jgi:hypothetical protein